MRKIYSILLAAVSLLFSASLSAVDVTTRQQIQDAINGATEGQTVNILLKSSIDVNATITIQDGQIVNVDLNGYNMNAEGAGVFILRKGTLNITGTGTIEKTGKTETDAIRVYGSTDPTVANYSNLTIGENVYVNVHGPKKKDTKDGLEEEGYMIETTNAITVMETGSAAPKAAYGVNIEIKGKVYGSKYGVKINGLVTANVFTNEYDNRPYVHVASTAEVSSNPSTNNATAIYSSGVGRFLIEGYVHGASAVFVKSGTVELKDAVVKSDYVGTFNDDHTKKGSGVNARGSAITIQSQSNYAGGQAVTIKGDTKVEAGSGYAVEETITTGTTKVNSIVIEGGTLETGDKGKGAILFTEETVNASNEKTANIEIIGGNIDNYVEIKEEGGAVVASNVDQFLPKEDTELYKTTSVTDPETGKTTIVVTKFEDVADMPVTANSVVAADENTGIEWTVTADTEETLTADKTLTYLEAISAANKQTLNVGDADHQVTLKVGRIVLGTKAQIVVAAGSRLIVDGEQGIVAPSTSNIVLRTSEAKYAEFIFNPAVTSNRHPNATIEFTSKAYTKEDNGTPAKDRRVYEFFGSPMSTVESVTSNSTYTTWFDVWNLNHYDYIGTINGDKAIDYSLFSNKFGFYAITAANPQAELQTYTFKGQLIGNDEPEIPVYINFSSMANAYMASMDVMALAQAMIARKNSGSNVDVAIYTYEQYGNEIQWSANNPVAMETNKIAPMRPFLLHNNGAKESMKHSYAGLVWTPATTPASAPARVAAMDMTKATIRVQNAEGLRDNVTVAQSDEFTSGRDMFDAVKYMNTALNIYVMDDEKMNIFTTDNLDRTFIGFETNEDNVYTISFDNVQGDELVLTDLMTNRSVVMNGVNTYEFAASKADNNEYRFMITSRRNTPTNTEEVAEMVKQAGIYTLTGLYIGSMEQWNSLPAGVYIVNGEKRVK